MPVGPDDVGRRVVLRHLLADGRATDVLGELLAWDDPAGYARVATTRGEVEVTHFLRNAFETGLRTLETRLGTEPGTGRFCQGDAVSHADLCLVSLWVGTGIFGIDTAPYPTVARIAEACLALPEVAEAHPLRQPGAPQA